MKILITGGMGYVGSHIAKFFYTKNIEIVIIDNLSRSFKCHNYYNKFYNVDLLNYDDLYETIKSENITHVIHLASFAYVNESVINPQIYYENNLIGSLNLLKVMIELKIKNIIFSSTCSVYEQTNELINETSKINPINTYAKSKLMIEEIIKDYSKQYDFNYVIFRFFNVSGSDLTIGENHSPETHLIPLVINAGLNDEEFNVNGKDYITKDGTCIRDYIHVNDLALAHEKVLTSNVKNEIFNLGNAIGYSILDVILKVENILCKKIKINFLPRRVGDPTSLVCDFNKAKIILNWEPKHDLTSIVNSSILWEKQK